MRDARERMKFVQGCPVDLPSNTHTNPSPTPMSQEAEGGRPQHQELMLAILRGLWAATGPSLRIQKRCFRGAVDQRGTGQPTSPKACFRIASMLIWSIRVSYRRDASQRLIPLRKKIHIYISLSINDIHRNLRRERTKATNRSPF